LEKSLAGFLENKKTNFSFFKKILQPHSFYFGRESEKGWQKILKVES
jgi:hypothetical protein